MSRDMITTHHTSRPPIEQLIPDNKNSAAGTDAPGMLVKGEKIGFANEGCSAAAGVSVGKFIEQVVITWVRAQSAEVDEYATMFRISDDRQR
ncbi:unnamed protein product [Linum trigynum]|uniref:Uncharacterized protein n=1 Tax=Linum trigynum TaxID=586398 RepID=A0AAV2FEN4_9ROSI